MENKPSAYKIEEQWKKDTRSFFVVFAKHWEGWVAIILSGATASILQWQGGVTVIPGWALWVVAMSGVTIAAFKTWRDQKRIAEAKELELKEQKEAHEDRANKMATKFEQSEAHLSKLHAAEKERAESKIKILQAQIDDREKLKTIKTLLGDCLGNLRVQADEVRKISRYSFEGDVRQKAEAQILEIVNRTFNLLSSNLGPAEAEMFHGAKPSPLPEPKNYDMFTERVQEWNWRINWLDTKYAELKKILEKLD